MTISLDDIRIRVEEYIELTGKPVTPLSEHTILDFETLWNITLPEEYRSFFLEIGVGEEIVFHPAEAFWYGTYPIKHEIPKDFLTSPFPFTQRAVYSTITSNIESRDERRRYLQKLCRGALALCDEGGYTYPIIIISGKERGNIWWTDGYGDWPLPVSFEQLEHPDSAPHTTSRITFLEWCAERLDYLIGEAKSTIRRNKKGTS